MNPLLRHAGQRSARTAARERDMNEMSVTMLERFAFFIFLLKIFGVTLIHKITQVSSVQFNSASHMYHTAPSPPEVRFPSITICLTPFIPPFALPPSPFLLVTTAPLSVSENMKHHNFVCHLAQGLLSFQCYPCIISMSVCVLPRRALFYLIEAVSTCETGRGTPKQKGEP